jgi:ABC-type amino acid transport substrate-binding protein/ABC-type amino acid transport system permease subunit
VIARFVPSALRLFLAAAVWLTASVAAPAQTLGTAGAPLAEMRTSISPFCGLLPRNSVETRLVCDGVLRVGLRADYPRFAESGPSGRTGFEVDIAREIAARLGVPLQIVTVTPVNRLAQIEAGEVDLVIATMGHNTQRDPTVRFLRPHYYQSETIVVGATEGGALAWDDLAARLVCTTVGNYSNVILAPEVGRLMLFSRPQRLTDALENDVCPLIAQDDSLLLPLIHPETGNPGFERKLGFAPVPWGMAMPLSTTPVMSAIVSDLLIGMHADGTFLRMAENHALPTAFLAAEQLRWRDEACLAAPDTCIEPPLDVELEPSAVAGLADRIEATLAATLGLEVRLGFMESAVGWRLFLAGLGASTLAVLLALVATALIAIGIAAMLVSRVWAVRMLAHTILTVLQNTPMMLVLVVMGALSVWAFSYTFASAMLGAILAIAGMNGSFAGAAIAEAYDIAEATPTTSRFMRAIGLASVQFDSYLINAVRGISAASVVGVPDLVNALNDITAFSGSQWFYYFLLVVFYIAAVLLAAQATRLVLPRLIPSWKV